MALLKMIQTQGFYALGKKYFCDEGWHVVKITMNYDNGSDN
jgi:hypothetical protein